MALDLYEDCPGGTNKKIKFCACAKDCLTELNKVDDAIAGGQRAAALSQLNRLLQSKGNRPCFLALKGLVQLELSDTEGYIATAETFLRDHPENSEALGMSAVATGARGDVKEAITLLQRALQHGGQNLHVYYAVGFLSDLCLNAGFVLAARGHSALQMMFAPEKDTGPLRRQLSIFQAPNVPLLLKESIALAPSPESGPWKAGFDAAMTAVERGCWLEAATHLQPLAERFPQEPAILKNLAVLYGWLAREDEAATLWHRYAALPGIAFDEAVEAEALAQLLSSVADEAVVEQVVQTYPVSDTDRVMERLLSEKHLASIHIDRAELDADTPPPRGAFWLLDRPMPASAKGLQVADVPNVLGELYLYGRETDREARLEFVVTKTPDLEHKVAAVQSLLGEFGGPPHKEEPTGEVAAGEVALGWRWRLPHDVSLDERTALIEAKRRDVNLNVWPTTPMPELDGKSPHAVAADPAYRVRLAASILLQELSAEQSRSPFDYDELRTTLGLPLRGDFAPAVDVAELPIVELHRLPPEKLTDKELETAYARAVMHAAPRATRRFGEALLQREYTKGKGTRAEIYGVLGGAAVGTEEAADCFHRAYEAALADGVPAGRWAVHELQFRAIRGEAEQFGSLLQRIQTRHIREPDVDRLLFEVLVRIGAITPDGQPVQRRPGDGGPASGPAAGPEAATAPAGLWTPGSPAPAAGGDKPKLWIPGT